MVNNWLIRPEDRNVRAKTSFERNIDANRNKNNNVISMYNANIILIAYVIISRENLKILSL